MKRLCCIVLSIVVFIIFGWQPSIAETELPDELMAVFEYDSETPFQITQVGSETRAGVLLLDITYPSPVDGEQIAAYLIKPDKTVEEGSLPAVLYVHWYDSKAKNSNRTQFIEEAVLLAEEGVVSLLPETMWSKRTWYGEGRSLETDYPDAIHQVIELRRALDVLAAQPQVDPQRLAYVGHDFGGMYGTVMGGVDRRPMAYVMIAAASNFNKWMLFAVSSTREGLEAYKAKMDQLAPTRFIPYINAPVLFQFGTFDFYTPQDDRDAFYEAAVEPKHMLTYSSGHEMNRREIQTDRLNFLREHLKRGNDVGHVR